MAGNSLFISRASADAPIAERLGELLKSAGYDVILQEWDFANRNFMERMHAALSDGARVIALLSPEYLQSAHCQAEWQNAIAGDPLNAGARLTLLRVAECEPAGLLGAMPYWDLVPVVDNFELLRGTVLDAVREQRPEMAVNPYWRAARSLVDPDAIRPVLGFSGRDAELEGLATALSTDGGLAVVHGLGGVGKSSIAREYAWRNLDRYSVVWWLVAETEDAIVDGLLRLGALMVRGLDRHADRRAAAQQVVGTMLGSFEKPVLLIFDNLEDERILNAWRPRTPAHVIVTARSGAWSGDFSEIALHEWSAPAAVRYLLRESRRPDLSDEPAAAIVEALGALPLAVAHAAAYLRATRTVTPQRYLERIGEHLAVAPRSAEYPRSVFATFAAAIAQAESEAPGAATLLCFAAQFAPDAIPDELFRQSPEAYAALPAAMPQSLEADDVLGTLDRLSLLAFSPANQTYAMHRLVRLAARGMVAGESEAWARGAAAAVERLFPEESFATWPQSERLVAHARATLESVSDEPPFLPAARLANRCAIYLMERAEYSASEALQTRAVAIMERTLGPEHLDTARALNNLATLYVKTARLPEAVALFERALAIREAQLGPMDPLVAAGLNNLGIAYEGMARYDEAIALHKRALALREQVLGPEHLQVAVSLTNLATAYEGQGRIVDAEAAATRALEILKKTVEPDHPWIALVTGNLANYYRDQGRYAEAMPLHARCVELAEKDYGPDHPTVANNLNGYAVTCARQGLYEEAERLHQRALAIRERALGPEHSDVAKSLHGLAQLYDMEGRFDDATPLYERALAIFEKSLGSEHKLTRGVREDLATRAATEERAGVTRN